MVIIPAGVPRKPGMTRDDLFAINAGIIRGIAQTIASTCPTAIVLVVTNPVNSMIPIVVETLKAAGVYDAHRVAGVTTLDVLRAQSMIAGALNDGTDPSTVSVPVIGGHSGTTIVPVLSQATVGGVPCGQRIDDATAARLTDDIRTAGTVVIEAKAGRGSATLSMATAGARLVDVVVRGLLGEEGCVEAAYMNLEGEGSCVAELIKLDYFAVPILWTPSGGAEDASARGVLEGLNAAETAAVETCKEALGPAIEKGKQFAADGAAADAAGGADSKE